ncbi:PKD domain-containing protein, partial [Thiobacillus sp.]
IALSGADSVNEGSAYTLGLAALVDPGTETATGYSINWGDGTVQNFTPAEYAALGGSAQHTYADGAAGGTARTIEVSASDEDGTFVAGSKSLTVNNVAPTAVLLGADSLDEGGTYTLNIVGSDPAGANDTLSYSIDWGDGSAAQNLTAAQLAALSGNVTHLFADDQDGPVNATPRTIQVTVADEDGGSSSTNKSVTVNNVAPVITLAGANSVNEGATYTLTLGTVTDPGTDTVSSYVVNWGDGSSDTYASTGDVTHTYADGTSSPTITVDLVDEDGTHTAAGSKSLTVNNVAPTAVLLGADSLDEGGTYTLNIVGSDPAGANDTLSYSIDWGDGSAAQNLTAAQLAALSGNVTHLFADDQDGPVNATPRTIQVTVADEDGGSSSTNKSVTVNNVAPIIALAGAANVVEDTAYTLTLGAVTDPGTDTVSSYVVHWGDGTESTYATAGDVTHTFADPSNYTISVDLVDEDGTHSNAGSKAVTVDAASATLSVNAGADTSLDEGATLARTIAFSDGQDNGAAGWSYSIDYGDGSAVVNGATLVKSLDLNHQYTDGNANRTVTVSLTDEVGETASDSFLVTVNNVAPLIAIAGAASVNEGATYTLTLGAVTDPGTDTVTSYVVNWGDGTQSTYAAAGDVTHAYADGASTPTITVDLVDEDGIHTAAGSKSITVDNMAPTIALAGANSVDEGTPYTLTLGAVTDPGTDTVSSYVVNWGDGSQSTYLGAGDVTHVYGDGVGDINRTITVDLVDEDGTHLDAGSKGITVNDVTAPTIIHLGDASGLATTLNPYVWAPFWTDAAVDISHKANLANAGEAWTPVNLSALGSATLLGGDLYAGDLGVSGKNLATSTISQELSGAEALRFDLDNAATKVTVDLTKFFVDDDANVFNYNEAGRMQALDEQGNVLAEVTFVADSTSGKKSVTLEHDAGFSAVVVTAGVYDGSNFVFGAYANDAGAFATAPYNDGKLHGSDFLVDSVEFELAPVIGVNPDPGL